MSDYTTSIGLDVHARSIKGCAFNPYTGEVERKTFAYDPAAVAAWALSSEAPRAVYESGVTGFHLCREPRALGVDCVVGAVSKMLRPAADRRVKTDRRDAESLAKQLAMHEVCEVHVPDEECEYAAALEHYVGRAEAAVEEKRALEAKARALAEALEELAEHLGIPAANFVATVAPYNELAEAGADEDGKEWFRMALVATSLLRGAQRRHLAVRPRRLLHQHLHRRHRQPHPDFRPPRRQDCRRQVGLEALAFPVARHQSAR